MHRKTHLRLTDLNPLLTCSLCKGYLIDATTLTECLHSFCRSCLVRYFHTSENCPTCDTLVHKTRPLQNVRPDRALQNIVYRLVPGLFKDEMKKRRDFYSEHPIAGSSTSSSSGNLEARGEISDRAIVIYTDEEYMNLSLEYFLPYGREGSFDGTNDGDESTTKRTYDVIEDVVDENEEMISRRYLRCPAAVCVKHIKKFVKHKFELKPEYEIEITHADDEEDPLPDDYTLMDVAYIYGWRRIGPLPLVFRVLRETHKRHKINHVEKPVHAPSKISERTPEVVDQSLATAFEKPAVLRNASVPSVKIVTSNDVGMNGRQGKNQREWRDVIDLKGNGSYRVSPEINLTERQLLPKLRLPMINIFQTRGDVRLTTGETYSKAMTEGMDRQTIGAVENVKNVRSHRVENGDKRLSKNEIIKDEIEKSNLGDASKITETNEQSYERNGNGVCMQMESEGIPIDTSSTLSFSPVVPVR